nr:putative ribonuclease h protein [Quercus suber]
MKERIDPNLLAICFWLVWNKRNSDRLGESSVALGRIRAKAATLLHDFRTAQLSQPLVSTIVARAARWTPPLSPHLKINFGGATFKDLGCAGVGVVVRNSTGAVIGAFSQRIMMPSSAAIVELLACRKALVFAKDLGVVQCIVEGDAKVIIKALRQRDSSHPQYGHVIQDVLFLASDFQSCCFSHVKRLGNLVAHCLARSSKSGTELQVWYNSTQGYYSPCHS